MSVSSCSTSVGRSSSSSEEWEHFPDEICEVIRSSQIVDRSEGVLRYKIPDKAYRHLLASEESRGVFYGKDQWGSGFLEVCVEGFSPIFFYQNGGWEVKLERLKFKFDVKHQLVGELSRKFLKLVELLACGKDGKEIRRELGAPLEKEVHKNPLTA